MRCPFCDETIQEKAIVCRFCGADRRDGEWQFRQFDAPQSSAPPKGVLTFQSAGAFFFLSAIWEGYSVNSAVALFGTFREGAVAWTYHLGYLVLFTLLGWAYCTRSWWGARMTYVTALVVSLDRVMFLLDKDARHATVLKQVEGSREVLDFIGEDTLQSMMSASGWVTLVSWWGLALFVWMRREYFKPRKNVVTAPGEE